MQNPSIVIRTSAVLFSALLAGGYIWHRAGGDLPFKSVFVKWIPQNYRNNDTFSKQVDEGIQFTVTVPDKSKLADAIGKTDSKTDLSGKNQIHIQTQSKPEKVNESLAIPSVSPHVSAQSVIVDRTIMPSSKVGILSETSIPITLTMPATTTVVVPADRTIMPSSKVGILSETSIPVTLTMPATTTVVIPTDRMLMLSSKSGFPGFIEKNEQHGLSKKERGRLKGNIDFSHLMVHRLFHAEPK